MKKQWFVFYTKSRQEKKVRDLLLKSGYEVFLPMHKVMRQWSDRKKKVEVPLFNSYIFVNDLEHNISNILKTPLSPDDRQSICRVIGSLIHASKRRIQIDQFLNNDLLELIAQVQSELPNALQEEINENERARKLNPPADKRSKDIQAWELSKRQVLLQGLSGLHNITPVKNLEIEEFVTVSK